jgi:hypothetical protein
MSAKVAPTPGSDEGTAPFGIGYGDVNKPASWKPAGFKRSFFSNKAASDLPTEEMGSSIWWTLENLRMSQAHFPDYVSFLLITGILGILLCCGAMISNFGYISCLRTAPTNMCAIVYPGPGMSDACALCVFLVKNRRIQAFLLG